VLGGGGFGGVTFGVGVLGAAVFDDCGFEDCAVEVEFGELVAAELEAAGLAGAGFGGDGNSLTDLSPVPALALSAGAAAGGDVSGGGVHAGASSGINGAVEGVGPDPSAQRFPAAETTSARVSPPANAQRRARDARTVDISTGKKSIEFGPAFSDALRNTSRLGKSRSGVTGDRDLRQGRDAADTLRASAQRKGV
jgi:hypothetical protein